jgi:hypothetical protein
MLGRTSGGSYGRLWRLARSCPFNSMAPVLAIADLVADRLSAMPIDLVGETSTPIATGPSVGRTHERSTRTATTHPSRLNRKQRKELARRLQSADPDSTSSIRTPRALTSATASITSPSVAIAIASGAPV